MKKLISVSDTVAKKLEAISNKEGVTQSSIVQTALTIYLLMYDSDSKNGMRLNDMITSVVSDQQLNIFDMLKPKR